MSIEFIKGFGEDVPVSFPVFPQLHGYFRKLDDRITELLEMFSEHYKGARNVQTNFSREWGYVKVAADTMKEMGCDHREFICPVPFVLDADYVIPKITGEQVPLSGWEAGLTIMYLALDEYVTFCVYAAQILEVTEKQDVIAELKEVIGGVAIETVISNASANCEILIQIGCELNLLNMFEIID